MAEAARAEPQIAIAQFHGRRLHAAAAVRVTPAGLLAIGGLVAAILLAIPPIIRAARAAPSTNPPRV